MLRIILITTLFILLTTSSSFAVTPLNNRYKNLFEKQTKTQPINLADLSELDKKILDKALKNVKNEDWKEALSWGQSMKDESFRDATIDYVLWQKYTNIDPKDKGVEFENIRNFINLNPYLPNIKELRTKAEDIIMENEIPYQYTYSYFKRNPVIKTKMAMELIQMKKDDLLSNSEYNARTSWGEIENDIVKIWINHNFTKSEEHTYLNKYYEYLTEKHHIARIDRLLIDKKTKEAGRIFKYVSENYQRLFLARLKIQQNPKYINNILRSIPRELRADEGLLLRRVQWYHKRRKASSVIDILLDTGNNTKYASKWIRYKKYYTREALQEKKYKRAYLLIKDHGLTRGGNFAEAEWLSGWIALRFLNQPKLAYTHFSHLYDNVSYPSSVCRGAYWAGRAQEELGEKKKAIKWYGIAEKYPTVYYGQLAIHNKYALLNDPELVKEVPLPKRPKITKKDVKNVVDSRAVKMAYLLASYRNQEDLAKDIFRYAMDKAKTRGEVATIVRVVKSLNDKALTANITRYATYKNVFFIDDSYPVIRIINKNNKNAHLVHSIIKQESGFKIDAKSRVGARGFMQLMPATAKNVARQMKVPYNKGKLTRDPIYNIRLGSYYINSLINKYDGYELLAIAAYNAGPNNVNRWIKQYYDPRKTKDINKVIDWIELISFSETRNYVQKILEGAVIYKYVLKIDELDFEVL
jgi:soluble lytic murein transglycosylase